MKKTIFMMMCAIIAVAAIFAAPTVQATTMTTETSTSQETAPADKQKSLLSLVPKSIVIEQTATLSDGRTVTIYYQKNGDICEVYSNYNLQGYDVSDIVNLKSTSFRVVSKPEGRLI